MAVSSPPTIHAAARLPPVISFSSPEEPEIELEATLVDSPTPITILTGGTSTWPFGHSVTIRNTHTGAEQFTWLQNIDAQRRRPPSPVSLTRGQEHRFVTLRPGESIRSRSGFRPLGNETPEQAREPQPGSKYRAMRFGMHALEIGEEYSIAIRPGLSVDAWMEGSKEDLMVEEGQDGGEWKPRTEKVEIEAAEPVVFRVEA